MTPVPPALVCLRQVPDYDPDRVLAALRACLEPLGGMGAFVRPGQRVLLKPNLLGPFAPARAVTTHPAVVRAAILLVREAGGLPLVGDGPSMADLPDAARAAGLDPVLEETGAELLDLGEPGEFDVPDHRVAPRLTLARALETVDVLISLPKLKTHGQMTVTGALKNQYGLIPGGLKSQWHFRLQEPRWLAGLILDVHRAVRPALAIMDAVVAMEGPGPTSGRPRQLGALLAGADLAAVDTVACGLIGQDPRRVPLLAAAREQGCGQTDPDRIRVEGDDWRALAQPGFEKVGQPVDLLRLLPLPRPALRWLQRQWTLRPRIVDGRCTGCGLCEQGCPVKPSAIRPRPAKGRAESRRGTGLAADPSPSPPAGERAAPVSAPGSQDRPGVDDERCIHCYCCHEFCPSHGIVLHEPWLARHLPLDRLADRVARLLGRLQSK